LSALRTSRLNPPRKYSWYSFLLEDESTGEAYCDRNDYVNDKIPMTPSGIESGLWRSVSTNPATVCPEIS